MPSIPRFFCEDLPEEPQSLTLNKKESRHGLSVLRLKPGHVVTLFDGKGRSVNAVVRGKSAEGLLEVSTLRASLLGGEDKIQILLVASVIKSDRMDLLIEKSCELGVSDIYPVITERSVVRLSAEAAHAKTERWKKIAEASAKQCGRARLPEIHTPREFSEFLKNKPVCDAMFLATLQVEGRSLVSELQKNKEAKRVLFLIGPEGDFTLAEARMALGCGAQAVSLGERVLRAETASLYALSVLQFFYTQDN